MALAAPAPQSGESGSRKDEIVAIAMVLFAEQGFQATTVRDIANAAGILSGSLYSHFSSKDAILDEGLRAYIGISRTRVRDLATSDVPPVVRVRLAIEQAVHAMAHWPAAAAVMHRDWDYISAQERFSTALDLRREFDEGFLGALGAARETGGLASDVDIDLVLQFMRAVLGGIVRQHSTDDTFPAQQLADHLTRMLFGGLGAALIDDLR